MGNLLGSCTIGDAQSKEALLKPKTMLQIVRVDGKILEFTSPVIVKDLLVSYPDFYVGIFKEARQPLPLDHKLKVGKMYYLLPNAVDRTTQKTSTKEEHDGDQRTTKTTTIKVVITKEQLQQILTKQGRVEELLLGGVSNAKVLNSISNSGCSPSSHWFPKLESIPEGSGEVVC